MAKDKEEKPEGEESALSKIVTTLFVILFIIIWLAIFAVLIKFDVGGFGSTVLRPILRDVPIINKILPEVSDEELAEENNYPYRNLTEAMKRIEELEGMVAALNEVSDGDVNTISELQNEIARLKEFEDKQLAFEKRVYEFDKNVVFADQAPGLEAYKQYYEEISPENAEEIYRQVVQQIQTDKRIQEQAAMYKSMKPKNAAAILSEMTGDLDLVAKILMNMKTKEAGAILAEMESDMAAKITKKMSVMNLD